MYSRKRSTPLVGESFTLVIICLSKTEEACRLVNSQTVLRVVNERAETEVTGKLVTSNSGGRRDRTDDLRLAKPALSQLSYAPF